MKIMIRNLIKSTRMIKIGTRRGVARDHNLNPSPNLNPLPDLNPPLNPNRCGPTLLQKRRFLLTCRCQIPPFPGRA
jgi:hypothetical protein